MRIKTLAVALIVVAYAAFSADASGAGGAAEAKSPEVSAKSTIANNTKSCRDFVQKFYDWYVVQMNRKSGPVSLDQIWTIKASAFSTELAKRLKEDSAASAKVKDDIVGLDFDPILATQSDANKLVAGAVVTKGASYMVPMFDYTENKNAKEPAVTPELIYSNGNFVFTNFHYQKSDTPANSNLLGLLKTLRDDRAKYEKAHKK